MNELPYEEVNLRDYIEVILKYKWLIIGIFVIALIATGVITYTMSKTYKSDATIEIAKVKRLIYTQPEAKQLILSEKVLQPVIKKFSSEFKKRPSVESFREKIDVGAVKNTNFINLSLKYKKPKVTKNMLHSVIKNFFKIGNEEYKKELKLLKKDLQVAKKQVQSSKDSLQDLKNKVDELIGKKSKLPPNMMPKVILLKQVISETQDDYFNYLEKKSSINQKIQQATPFKVINSPEIPEQAIAPKKKQNLAISGIVSLMFAVFLAFFIEFMQTSEPSEKRKEQH